MNETQVIKNVVLDNGVANAAAVFATKLAEMLRSGLTPTSYSIKISDGLYSYSQENAEFKFGNKTTLTVSLSEHD